MQTQFEELKLAGNLPSPSGVGMAILRLTQNDDYTAEQLAHTIQSDPALTGRIVKMANSAQMGSARAVASVSEAVVRLGLRTVRNIALGFSLVSSYRDGKCRNFDYRRYWSESLARAIACQNLSRHFRGLLPAEAYICGLLSDIGRLTLACVHPQAYSELLSHYANSSRVTLAAAETAKFAIDHGEVAWCLLHDWNMPDAQCNAIQGFWRGGRDPDDRVTATLAHLLRIATVVVEVMLGDRETRRARMPDLIAAGAALKLDETGMFDLCDLVAREWIDWGGVLGVQTCKVPAFREIAEDLNGAAAEPAEAALQSATVADATDAAAADDTDAALGQLLVLVVDDDPVSLRLLHAQMKKAGYQVIEAVNGAKALSLALEFSPHLLVTDWMMPELDGIELVRSLRRTELGRDMYIVILTGADNEDQVVEAFRSGADDYVTKPCKSSILVSRVNAGERLVRLRDELARDKKLLKKQMAELAILNRKLNHTAVTDALTELPNRRFAMSKLEESWQNSSRGVSVIMADLDKFKSVNDQYGHDVGDHVLKEVSAVLAANLRGSDTVARLGGEEFLVICPNCPVEGAAGVAERLRAAVEAHHISFGGFSGRVTLSLGVAQRSANMGTQDDLLKAADVAVYQAKQSGRNKVVCSTATVDVI